MLGSNSLKRLLKFILLGSIVLFVFINLLFLYKNNFSNNNLSQSELDLSWINLESSSFDDVELENKSTVNYADDYEIIVLGYRAGGSKPSVIIKYNSKDYVLYEGDILPSGLKLVKIDYPVAAFAAGTEEILIDLNDE